MRHALALCALLAMVAAPAVAAPPPIAAFGQLPSISKITLSPDGSRWAAMVGSGASLQIQVRGVDDNKLLSVTPTDKSKVRDLQWVDNDVLIATLSTTEVVPGLSNTSKQEWFHLLALDLTQNKQWRRLLQGLDDSLPVAAGAPIVYLRDGVPFLTVPSLQLFGTKFVSSLAEVNVRKNLSRWLEPGNPDTIDWQIGNDGRAVARVDYNQKSGRWQLLAKIDGQFRQRYEETALLERPALVSFGRDTSTVLLKSHKDGEWADYDLALADGTLTGPIKAYAGDNVILDPRTHTVTGSVDVTLTGVTYNFLNPADNQLLKSLARAFPGEMVDLISWSDDRQVVAVEVQGDKNGDAFYLVDRKAKRAEFLANHYEALGPEALNPVSTLTYKAGDGMDIPAYLTLPRGRPAKALPLIVLPHGGPAARDTPGFDWWAQVLASRGYAVLQPQFRGSSGFGEAHLAAGYGQWGRKMQSDLADGVKHLAAAGTIDPKRVCIVGASYGGYAAMAGVTIDQGVYRCASAVAGVADLRRMLATEVEDMGGSQNATLRFWQRFMGAKTRNDVAIDAWSPARLADKVTVPLQLIHGKDDTVVRLEQSRLMADAMKAASKPVDFTILPGEDHWLSRPATRTAMLEAQIAFLEKHNPPDVAAASPAP
ncbi:MAG: S9 family peptidase [Sphingomonadales bacterium]